MRMPRLLPRRRLAALLAAGAAVLALGTLGALGASDVTPVDFAPPSDRPVTQADVTEAYRAGWADGRAAAMGDDNGDGVVDEDEFGWDCATMGNRQCGPNASPRGEGAPAGRSRP
ncbi:hypothetical protein [Streptomyces sp. NPDC047315]|uniref:hypothetical protein n=1 Tax=Streptomyces sp. NPDC047315 TaxID=3155142 RepID=UPI0033C58C6D